MLQASTSSSGDFSKTWRAHAILVKPQLFATQVGQGIWRAHTKRACVNLQKSHPKIRLLFQILACPREEGKREIAKSDLQGQITFSCLGVPTLNAVVLKIFFFFSLPFLFFFHFHFLFFFFLPSFSIRTPPLPTINLRRAPQSFAPHP